MIKTRWAKGVGSTSVAGLFLTIWLVFGYCVAAWAGNSINSSATTGANSSIGVAGGKSQGFQVFDGTLYKDKPDLSIYGLKPITIIYGENFWKHKSQMDHLPAEHRAIRLARETASTSKIVCIDIENWPVRGDDATVSDSVRKYAQLMQWFHDTAPHVQHGYYGVLPVGSYWRAIAPRTSPAFQTWQADNARLQPIAATADVVFPSLYTYYPDREAWVKFAIRQIRAAKKYGKPVYPFLWPQFHDSNWRLGGQYIPASYWKLELETVRTYADGVVIWGGWDLKHDRPAKWNNKAPWWQVTKEFMKQVTQ